MGAAALAYATEPDMSCEQRARADFEAMGDVADRLLGDTPSEREEFSTCVELESNHPTLLIHVLAWKSRAEAREQFEAAGWAADHQGAAYISPDGEFRAQYPTTTDRARSDGRFVTIMLNKSEQ